MPKGVPIPPERLARMIAARKAVVPPFEVRFWGMVDKNGPNGCWVWKGSTRHHGYGQMWKDGKIRYAHRISLELAGVELPAKESGLVVDHACRNTGCVNPAHLRIITQTENTTIYADRSRMKEKLRAALAKAPSIHCACGRSFKAQGYYLHKRACPQASLAVSTAERKP